ncbi:MAG: hypothetical protein K0R91_742 [Nitrososphaeraceae archaeon]|nr:hypothetical protein [Nitrososphaeraceae archaeon]
MTTTIMMTIQDDEGPADDLPQEGGCQGEDDFCDADEGCRSDDVDCIKTTTTDN